MTGNGAERSRGLRAAGYAVGVLLLLAALVAVYTRREGLVEAGAALRSPRPAFIVLLFAGVIANLLGSAAFLLLLLRRFGRVGWGEMVAVVCAATLLNYLPLRPGLFGRVAYHRVVNGIPVKATMRTIVEQVVISAALAVVLVGGLRLAAVTPVPWWCVVLVVTAVPVLIAAGAWRRATVRDVALATAVRGLELLAWAVRYQAAFALLDQPLAFEHAVVLAAVAALATMVPFVSNGLGLREWAIGLAAPLLAAVTLEVGVTAELVNRAAELIVIVPAGVVGMMVVRRRMGRVKNIPHP